MGTMTFPLLVKSLKAKELTKTIKTWRRADFCQALNVCEFDWRSTGAHYSHIRNGRLTGSIVVYSNSMGI